MARAGIGTCWTRMCDEPWNTEVRDDTTEQSGAVHDLVVERLKLATWTKAMLGGGRDEKRGEQEKAADVLLVGSPNLRGKWNDSSTSKVIGYDDRDLARIPSSGQANSISNSISPLTRGACTKLMRHSTLCRILPDPRQGWPVVSLQFLPDAARSQQTGIVLALPSLHFHRRLPRAADCSES